MEYKIPFICPHCDDDYYVIVERDPDGDREFRCPSCHELTSVRGAFNVIGPE